jgi:hypothetical protein
MTTLGSYQVPTVARKADAFEVPSKEQFEQGLRRLVAAIERHYSDLPPPILPPKMWLVSDLWSMPDGISRAQDILHDPVAYSLRRGVNAWGKSVAGFYGMRGLSDLVEAAAHHNPIVDLALDGVTDGGNTWGA